MFHGILKVGDAFEGYEPGILEHGPKMVLLKTLIEESLSVGDKILVFRSVHEVSVVNHVACRMFEVYVVGTMCVCVCELVCVFVFYVCLCLLV